ncbi:hypothetical protein BSKO_06470 [Bryopsis sp. KO-2023]|nr:hypothetical protein BSKO_06470 [Bryopsis sp. KO-2023]
MPIPKVRSRATLFFEILAEDDGGESDEKLRRVSMSVDRPLAGIEGAAVREEDDEGQNAPENSIREIVTGGGVLGMQSQNLADMLHNLLNDLYVDSTMLKMGEVLGEGGFATVSKCSLFDAHSGASQSVAVKVLKPDLLSSPDDLNEFIMEANLQRKLKHRNIVKSIGIGATDLTSLSTMRRSMFFVQEYMDRGTLKDMVLNQMLNRHTEVYSLQQALKWLVEVANAMHYLHSVCRPMIIHRDLKLENILLSGQPPVAKLCDFGLHKRLRGRNRSYDNLANAWQSQGVTEGSYYGGSLYMANLLGGKDAPTSPGFLGYNGTPRGSIPFSEAVIPGTGPSPQCQSFPILADSLSGFESEESPSAVDATSRGGQLMGQYAAEAGVDLLLSNSSGLETPKLGTSSQSIPIPNAGSRNGETGGTGRKIAGHLATSISNLARSVRSRTSNPSIRSGSSGGEGLTQKVGSTVYMAPEVVMGQKYNEKVDVFSFGVIMYEVLMQSVILVKYAMMEDKDELNTYADRVAEGHREPIPSFWPDAVKQLVEDCWKEKADDRPTFREILARFSQIESSGMIYALKRPRNQHYSPICDCGCCSVM